MNFGRRITLYVLLYITLCSTGFAQVVDIPDPNLEAAIRRELQLLPHEPITKEDMAGLEELNAHTHNITDLTGLEYATNLRSLILWGNSFDDLSPIANLTQLSYLDLSGCSIDDITALSKLTNLTVLNVRHNVIVDISPLSRLTNLFELRLTDNNITDIAPLANLTRLELLEIEHNNVIDHSPLDGLALSHFTYDQTCELAPFPVRDRIKNRSYPSIVARWSVPGWPPILNRPELTGVENLAQHDLWFSVPMFGLQFEYGPDDITIVGNLDEAIRRREEYLTINPNMVFLVQVRMRSSGGRSNTGYLPEDSPHWVRDAQGNIVEGELIDFTHPYMQDRIVRQAIAVSKCGLYDGIFFDWWNEHDAVLADLFGDWSHKFRGYEAEQRARDSVLRRIRAETRPDFLIMGNTNYSIIPRTGPYINGGFMETTLPAIPSNGNSEINITTVEQSLNWLDTHLRAPRINALDTYEIRSEPLDSPANLRWMRVATTLSLTHSDGYVSFTSAVENYRHYWYDFWDADLGQPVGEKAQVYEGRDGLYIREFTNGWAAYNHSGAEQTIMLPELTTGVASRLEGQSHTLPNLDGEIYLRVTPPNPADVNGDGVVNILDLTLVAQGFGSDSLKGDVNGDGVVNVFDLVQVAGALGGGGAAPSAYSLDPSIISAADVARWLAGAQGLGVGDTNFQRGIRFLEQLLAALTPKETTLLPNYPNPFNPETWIPYHLARGAEVAITIYDTKGTLVRRLALGNQEAGYYAERGKAAYWDGRNEGGEAVASGIYIYQFRAGDYAASRRMVIVK